MDRWTGAVALGTAITTTLVVTSAVIELLAFEFASLFGIPVGLLAGLSAASLVAMGYHRRTAPRRRVVAGVAAFGYVVVVFGLLTYVNLLQLDQPTGLQVMLSAGLLAAVITALAVWYRDSLN